MYIGQRAFAKKLNKRGAAEVRQQVSSAYLSELPKSISGTNLAANQHVVLADVVEPPDFEEYLLQHQNVVERDAMYQMFDFPDDDLHVSQIERELRTLGPLIPERGAESDLHVRDCVKHYTSDYTKFSRKYESSSCQHWLKEDNDGTLKSSTKQEYEVDVDDESSEKETYNTSSLRRRASLHLSDTPRSSWASSMFDLKNCEADPLLHCLLERDSQEVTDSRTAQQRMLNRQDSLFDVYPEQPEDEIIERREAASIPREHFGHRIMVKCLKLELEFEVEPIFASMALYDARERKKISENFYFDMTPEHVKKLLHGHIPYQDISTLSRQCVFSLSHPSPDVFLVVRLEKVLQQGDISEAAEPYIKDDNRNRERARQAAVHYCERLGAYRMPFAWTAIYLMNVVKGAQNYEQEWGHGRSESLERKSSGGGGMMSHFDNLRTKSRDEGFTRQGSLERGRSASQDSSRSSWYGDTVVTSSSTPAAASSDPYGPAFENFRPVTLTVSSFFKQEADKLGDEDLYKYLSDLKRPTSVIKKLKYIPGVLQLDISPCPEEPRYCLTPELVKIEPYPDEKGRPTKEMVEFPVKEVYQPHTTYRNLLYIYPKNLNFANRQGSARNIAVKIQLMYGEEQQFAMQCLFGKSSCPEFSRHIFTTVTYHNKTPEFYEEVKCKLPAKLEDKHHLLFTFYHISCQKKSQHENTPVESPIGYTWLPLLRDGRLITGEVMLPVSLDKPPPNYSVLHPDVQLPGMKWVDNHKPLFQFCVSAVSSLHTQDENLDKFFSLVHAAETHKIPPRIGEANFEKEVKNCIGEVFLARQVALVGFMPLVLDKLLQLMCRAPVIAGQVVNLGQSTFEAVAQVVKKIQGIEELKKDQHGRNALLTSYIEYSCSLPHPEQMPMSPTSPNSGYATLGRPVSLPLSRSARHRSSSDPDLPGSDPNSPDNEVASIIGGLKTADRSGSFRQNDNTLHVPRLQGRKLVHEEIAYNWVVSSGSTKELALQNAWFFFEIMIKSMAEHLSRVDKLYSPRQTRFSSQYLDDVTSLVQSLSKDITDRYSRDWRLIQTLNNSLAFFCRDCFSLMDRGFVMNRIRDYCKTVFRKYCHQNDSSFLVALKLDFVRIVCSHEHYVTLNLPWGTMTTPSAPSSPTPSICSTSSQISFTSTNTLMERGLFTELTDDYRTQHFLSGLVLCELTTALDTSNNHLQYKAINVLRNLMTSHDCDPRYKDCDVKSRVALLYLPVLGIVIDNLNQLYDPSTEVKRLAQQHDQFEGINQNVAMAIASSAVYGTPASRNTASETTASPAKNKKSSLGVESTRHLLACVLWVLKNTEYSVLRCWCLDVPIHTLNTLLEVLYLTACNFEYKGKKALKQYPQQIIKKSSDMKSLLENAILGTGSARSDMMARRRHVPNTNTASNSGSSSPAADKDNMSSRLRWRKDQTLWKQTSDVTDSGRPKSTLLDADIDSSLEGILAAEASLIILDTLEMIIQIVFISEQHTPVLPSILKVLLNGLSLNQSTVVLTHMFATQRSLVSKFPELLFEEETEQCADLCLRLLRHCSSPITTTRSHASGSLYLLMRHNFEKGNNFSRVKMQVTMSLSSLVGQNQNFNEEHLRHSLKTILTYAETDLELQETSFPEQVCDLVFNLHMILSDTVKMKEYQEDPEMLLDLMYRIAKGYQNSPDLRLTWLQNMATIHAKRNNHGEAAQCLIHSAGLVAEYLNMLEDRQYLPVGCVSFQHVSHNVLEESAVSDDVVSPEEEGICTGKYFTELGLIGLLEQAASSFNMAGMYEAMNSVYKVLTPIYEWNRDFKKLMSVHDKLKTAFENIVKQEGKRIFGTYFRVGFYGEKFDDLNGEEFVYKEPAITKLAEISYRLETFYSSKLGGDCVEIVKDSNTVDVGTLNPDKAYIQITYVEPYFDLYELKDRKTFFDFNYNIKRFMYATPFTASGKAHGELQDQCKRKTILTTNKYFPYVKTRLSVKQRDEIILCPIEVAIEDIQKKTKELFVALTQEPPDAKMLQMVLQGCIGTTVNQGPVEVAQVFLAPAADGSVVTPTKHHNKLRISFKDFLKKCSDALLRNQTLIGSDQFEYQKEMERNYHSVKEKLMRFINHGNGSGTLKKKHRRDKLDRKSKSPGSRSHPAAHLQGSQSMHSASNA